MRDLTRIVVVLFLWLPYNCLGQSLPKMKTVPVGTISGRITLNGKAIAGIIVLARSHTQLYSDRGRAGFRSTTDEDGQFCISGLPAGTYEVSPNVPAFTVEEVGELTPSEKAIVLNEGETVEGIDFSIVRGGVITGRVSDADGRAVIGEAVRVVPTDSNIDRVLSSGLLEGFLTDDRGIYRIYGLPAGSYKVAVGETEFVGLSAIEGRRAYRQTFHPDVNEEAKAKLVQVTEGAEASNVDIALGRRVDGFSITGRILNGESGQPLSKVRLGFNIIGDGWRRGLFNAPVFSDDNGIFQVDNVPPGRYSIFIIPGSTDYTGETIAFDVLDQDISGLEVKAQRAATLAGTITVEGTNDKTILARIRQMPMRAFVRSKGGYPTGSDLTIAPDGSFQSGGLQAGTASVSFRSLDSETMNLAILRIERDGVDQSRGIKIGTGEQITGVHIVIGFATGSLRGTLKLENGTLSTSMYVYLQLQRQTNEGPVTIKSTQADSRGHFLIEKIPAGNYELLVTIYNARNNDNRVGARQAVVISDGIISEVSVPLNLKPTSTSVP